jgi:hypothetical protein
MRIVPILGPLPCMGESRFSAGDPSRTPPARVATKGLKAYVASRSRQASGPTGGYALHPATGENAGPSGQCGRRRELRLAGLLEGLGVATGLSSSA